VDKVHNTLLTLFDCIPNCYIDCMEIVTYPMFELSTIVEILKKARKAGNTINKQILANSSTLSGRGSTNSGIFNQKLAAFKHYNLAEVDKNQITFTPLANEVIQNENKALRIAFLAPETYSEMHTTLEKETLITKDLLLDIAQHKIGISEVGKERFIKNFVESGVYAGVIEYGLRSKDEIIVHEASFEKLHNLQKRELQTHTIEVEGQKAELKIANGKAIIVVPEKLTKEDKEKLKAQIELF
jgi:hypothetical protein